tara:strand:+ start:4623 stop:5792 length:1170 start_codon:yes stop_codon:yes gene_type:complete
MSVINEEKTYNLGVKLTSLPTQNQLDSKKGYTDKSYDSYLIYGTRNQRFSQDRKDVRKILDVKSNIYRVLSSAIRVGIYDGGITAAWLKRQFSNKTFYNDLQNLYRLMYNKKSVAAGLSPLSECVIITHKNKYNIDSVKTCNKINPYNNCKNSLNNAILLNHLVLEELFNDISEEWKKEQDIITNVDGIQGIVSSVMGEYKNLKDSISSYKKTTKNLNTYNDYNITKETLEDFHMYKNYVFYKALGNEYVKNSWRDWEDVERRAIKCQRFMSAITNSSYEYDRYTKEDALSFQNLKIARDYISSNESSMPNYDDYNRETRKYNFITLNDLPSAVDIAEALDYQEKVKNTMVIKVHEMKMKWLSAINLQSHELIVCEVTPQPLITNEKEE